MKAPKKATLKAMKRPAKVSTRPMVKNAPGMPGYRKGGPVKGKMH